MKRIVCVLMAIVFLQSLISCSKNQTTEAQDHTLEDDIGRTIVFSSDDRVAACHASFADCWLLAGGELVGVTSDAVEDHGLDVGEARIIGTAKTVNTEELIISGATVVLLSADLGAHLELNDTLEALGIKCAYFKVDTFDDYAYVMQRFCTVTGRKDLYHTYVTLVEGRIKSIINKLPEEEERSALLMRAYSSGIKAKSDDNLAGLIMKEYGLSNLADEHPSLLEDMSLEHIVAEDPDFIFVLTMGSEESARAYLRENIESNPAFAALSAVKEGNYHILPKDLFHYKPNERWDESYEYIAKIMYPEIFTEV